MLKNLQIENYALIEKLNIDFGNGLSTITGETGAGKSILVGALSLILGQRADTKVLLNKEKKCVVEGLFLIEDYDLKPLFEENGLDYDDQTILRREINQQGKSRAFINDTPVNLNLLKTISEKLVDIHSQHESLLINKTYFQYDVIDSFCNHPGLLNEYRYKFSEFASLKKRLDQLVENEKESRANLDYYKFQFNELEKANLENEENFDNLESELQILNNASDIKQTLQNSFYLLADSESNLLNELKKLVNLIQHIERYSIKYKELKERLESVYVELKDITDELSLASDDVVFDQERIAVLTGRLDSLNKLMMKHNVSTIEELIELRRDYQEKINKVEFMDEEIATLKEQLEIKEKEVYLAGNKLSRSRLDNLPGIENHITEMLRSLGMPNASFGIDHQKTSSLTSLGLDSMRFKFSANLGGEMQDISKVASGGEMSRLMLSIKSLVAKNRLLPTIIFDEIDTGVSGEIASKIAAIFAEMAKNMQVICITHLPQIASKGSDHLFVYKDVDDKQTKTRIKKLDNKERIEEVAKMLGGEKLTESARETAKELISFNKN